MKKYFFFALFFVLTHCYPAISQSNFKYELSLIPVSINGLPGIQSFAYAQYEGKWVIIGGRKDGLHARQPFNAFPAAQSNTDIYVIDIANKQFRSRSVNELPTNLKEQLQSTNLNYHQIEDTLYLIGGYGYSESSNNHITYPYLTTINIKTLIEAIEQDQPIQSHFKQMRNDVFAVTGGHLEHMYDKFYLVGGHRFDGRYNPMGNPTFTQAYTNQIRMFTIDNTGDQLQYSNYSVITDPVHLRRRDYNLLPQIFPNGKEGLTISSGVFQLNADLPFLYPVDITENGYEPITNFNQYLSNYHSAVANLHDSIENNMHSLFFGGISQYYYQNGALIKDDLVPFVKTISRLTRTGDGKLTEYQLPISMPSLQGAGSEFIVNKSMPHYSNEVLKLHEIKNNAFKIGHIFGGIQSNSLNPFSVNQTSSTKADNTIYEVWLTAAPVSVEDQIIDGHNPHDMDIFPNPFQKEFTASFHLIEATKVSYIITNALGKIIQKTSSQQLPAGNHTITIAIDDEHSGGPILMTMIFDDIYYVSKKLIQQ
jgi:hypothetical protein